MRTARCTHITPRPADLAPACSQYSTLTLCAAHGKKGRRINPFEGYADESEEVLYKHALKILKALCGGG